MNNQVQLWKIEFESEASQPEPVTYEWQELRASSRNNIRASRWLVFVGVLAGGFLLSVGVLSLMQESGHQPSGSSTYDPPAHKRVNAVREGCESAANAKSLAGKEPFPRDEVDFGGLKYQHVTLSCSGAISIWLVKWVQNGGVWEPFSATKDSEGAQDYSR